MAKRERRITSKKSIDRDANVNLCYTFLKQGKSIQWIENFFAESQDLKPITVRLYLMDARKLISTEGDMDIDFTSLLHDSRYEEIWSQEKDAYLEWHYVIEEAWEARINSEVVRRYNSLLKSMKQREEMYGLRDKGLINALHSNISLTKDQIVDGFEQYIKRYFDFEKLIDDELVELLQLLEKSYEGDLFDKKAYIEDDDEVKVVAKKQLELPLKSKKVITESIPNLKEKEKDKTFTKPTESIKIIDGSKNKRSPDTITEVNQKMNKNLLEYIKTKYGK
jgi:hypothetical protein